MKFRDMFAGCGIAAAIALIVGVASAQDKPASTPPANPAPGATLGGGTGRSHGNFDPAEFQKRIMDGVKDRLGFKDDTEWAAVQPLVQKVMDARRDAAISGMGAMFRFGRRSSGGGGSSPQGGDHSNRPSIFGAANPEAEALQKAIDDNVPAAQIKAALEKYRATQKEKEAKLAAAQDDLRKVLTVRQEAQATLMSLLP